MTTKEIFNSFIVSNNKKCDYPNENELSKFLLEKNLDKETIDCILKLLSYTYDLGSYDEYRGGVFNGISNPFK